MSLDNSTLNMFSKVFENVLLPIITSILSIKLYKYWLKGRYKKILIKNNEIYLLEAMFLIYTLCPFVIGPLISFKLSIFRNIKIFNIFIIVFSLFMTIIPIFLNLKNKQRGTKVKFIFSFILPTLVTILATWCLTFIIILFIEEIKLRSNNLFNTIKGYFIIYIAFYLVFGLLFNIIYFYKKKKLEIYSNRIDVFYMGNNDVNANYGVKFKDLDIDKEFISFYCDVRKKTIVIPRSSLIKIEYHYDKNTLK